MSDTPIGDMVETMLLSGVSTEALVLAVRTAETVCVTRHAMSRDMSQEKPVLSTKKPAVRQRRSRRKRKEKRALAEANDAAKAGAENVTPRRDMSRDAVTPPCNLSMLSSSPSEEATSKESKKEGNARARGTRLPPDATLSPENRRFTLDHGLEPDLTWVEFVDFWIGVPGARGRKLDWDATYRNRVRELAGRKKGRGPPARAQQPSFHELAASIRSQINVKPTASDQARKPLEGEIIAPPLRSSG
jgi:hypothetical protein